jgi:hypothetical protein
MAVFAPGKTISTPDAEVEVTVSADSPLPVGRHTFQLVVEDDSGNMSQPAVVDVIVRDTKAPTAVLDVPPRTEFGESFTLSGRRSSDVPPGKVVRYHWTLLPDLVIPDRVVPVVVQPTNPNGGTVTPGPVRPPVITDPVGPVINPVRPTP